MLQFAGGKCSVHQALLHCQPRLFHLGNAPTCQYKDSTQALFSYKSTSSSRSSSPALYVTYDSPALLEGVCKVLNLY